MTAKIRRQAIVKTRVNSVGRYHSTLVGSFRDRFTTQVDNGGGYNPGILYQTNGTATVPGFQKPLS